MALLSFQLTAQAILQYSMPIIAFGLNHRTAGIDLRGRASILPGKLQPALNSLVQSAAFVQEALILSTCNRTEVHAILGNVPREAAQANLLRWLANLQDLTLAELETTTYFCWDDEAVSHIIRVAAGLDSQVLGEPQILGQFKAAFDAAAAAKTCKSRLVDVATTAIRAAKRIRTETNVGRNSISVAQAAVIMARQIYSDLSKTRVLLLGAGETICLVSKHMSSAQVASIGIANRTPAHAAALAKQIGAHSMPLAEIGNRLHEYDILISSTNSPTTIVSREVVAKACNLRRFRPMFIVDLAVPRDIDPTVSNLDNVYLYTIDDLTSVIDENLKAREEAAMQAHCLVDEGVERYKEECRIRQVADLISDFRNSVTQIRDSEIDKARSRLQSGEDPQEVIERLGGDLANKLAHQPTIALKDAGKAKDQQLLEMLRNLFRAK